MNFLRQKKSETIPALPAKTFDPKTTHFMHPQSGGDTNKVPEIANAYIHQNAVSGKGVAPELNVLMSMMIAMNDSLTMRLDRIDRKIKKIDDELGDMNELLNHLKAKQKTDGEKIQELYTRQTPRSPVPPISIPPKTSSSSGEEINGGSKKEDKKEKYKTARRVTSERKTSFEDEERPKLERSNSPKDLLAGFYPLRKGSGILKSPLTEESEPRKRSGSMITRRPKSARETTKNK